MRVEGQEEDVSNDDDNRYDNKETDGKNEADCGDHNTYFVDDDDGESDNDDDDNDNNDTEIYELGAFSFACLSV